MLFIVVQSAECEWLVVDSHGEARHSSLYLPNALHWAALFSAEEALYQESRAILDRIQAEAEAEQERLARVEQESWGDWPQDNEPDADSPAYEPCDGCGVLTRTDCLLPESDRPNAPWQCEGCRSEAPAQVLPDLFI